MSYTQCSPTNQSVTEHKQAGCLEATQPNGINTCDRGVQIGGTKVVLSHAEARWKRQSSLTFPELALPTRPLSGDPILRVRFSASSRLVLSWRSSNASAINLFSCSSFSLVSWRSKTWPNEVDKLALSNWEVPRTYSSALVGNLELFRHTVLNSNLFGNGKNRNSHCTRENIPT